MSAFQTDNAISIVANFKVKEGTKDKDVEEVIQRFCHLVETNETATCLQYVWSKQTNMICCRESYRTVDGVTAHLSNVGHLFAGFMALVDVDSSIIHCPADQVESIKATPLGQWNAQFYATMKGSIVLGVPSHTSK